MRCWHTSTEINFPFRSLQKGPVLEHLLSVKSPEQSRAKTTCLGLSLLPLPGHNAFSMKEISNWSIRAICSIPSTSATITIKLASLESSKKEAKTQGKKLYRRFVRRPNNQMFPGEREKDKTKSDEKTFDGRKTFTFMRNLCAGWSKMKFGEDNFWVGSFIGDRNYAKYLYLAVDKIPCKSWPSFDHYIFSTRRQFIIRTWICSMYQHRA